MPHDPEAFADMVVMHTKAALAPVLADVKSLQTQVAGWESRWNDLGALRERVAVVESKAATEPRLEAVVAPAVDLSPVLERVAAAEARLGVLGDLRDRVITVETKAAVPVPPDAAFYELRDRIRSVEDKAAPVFEVPVDVLGRIAALEADHTATPFNVAFRSDVDAVLERLTKAEMRLELKAAETAPILPALADLTKDVGAMRERVAVLEVRPFVPGPPGEPGPAGKDGLDGKDGMAGLSFEGVYQEGKLYDVGQLATWAGSSWHCNEPTTTKPGDGSKAWTLMVKRGRDGKDGRDAEGALPVVAVGRAG